MVALSDQRRAEPGVVHTTDLGCPSVQASQRSPALDTVSEMYRTCQNRVCAVLLCPTTTTHARTAQQKCEEPGDALQLLEWHSWRW